MKEHPSSCHPLTLTRSLGEFPIGNVALAVHQRQWVERTGMKVHPAAWLDPAELEAFLASGCRTMVSGEEHEPLIWAGEEPDPASIHAASNSFRIHYPWDLLRAHEKHVAALSDPDIRGAVHASAVVEGVLHLGEGSRILPGVFIEGNVVIGANCKIGPNCYLRGNTSIGDGCHIGQSVEVKNSIILARTNVGHLSYVGDSILGEGVNLGAGTMVSNLRHDGGNHRSMVDGQLVDTGRRKFGVVMGDGVHTGIQTTIYPGRKLWPATTTRPAEVVERDIMR